MQKYCGVLVSDFLTILVHLFVKKLLLFSNALVSSFVVLITKYLSYNTFTSVKSDDFKCYTIACILSVSAKLELIFAKISGYSQDKRLCKKFRYVQPFFAKQQQNLYCLLAGLLRLM